LSVPDVDVAIVGGGPAGMAAALELRRRGVERVLLLDRETELGGIPRDCHHPGFGWFDLRRVLSGPAYARRYARDVRARRVDVWTEASATRWKQGRVLQVTSPRGLFEVSARAILLATGCRERPRAARLVPGARPAGVLTTGAMQRLMYGSGVRVGRRAVVVGAEHVSFSAVHTLIAAGTSVAAMVTDLPRHQTYAPLAWLAAGRHGIPVLAHSEVTKISGGRRVEAVEVADRRTGLARDVECDTVVFTGDWIPDHELARLGGLEIDRGTRGPRVDPAFRTSARGVFAAGNLLHGAETAGVAALEGRGGGTAIADYLRDGAWPEAVVPVLAEAPLTWVSPSAVVAGASGGTAPPARAFVARVSTFLRRGHLEVRQGSRLLHRAAFRELVPNRSLRLPGEWTALVTADAGPVTVSAVV
jgi:NADPH-dependent 2,4-dienoyl-CoA reductase/sulfur reductase-like enzyme